ncbi:ATP-binding cassette transporter [Coprinopsis sp. MPI-PUGE-AT-0042]|nr:ATP-binding cassette transporter [Coprinopsis sp. MPI-PUGE-AT-0042]
MHVSTGSVSRGYKVTILPTPHFASSFLPITIAIVSQLMQWASLAIQPGLVDQVADAHKGYEASKSGRSKIWRDSMIVPAYIALASAVVLVLHAGIKSRRVQRFWARVSRKEASRLDTPLSTPHIGADIAGGLSQHTVQPGTTMISSFRGLRLLSCFALVGLSIYTAIPVDSSPMGSWSDKEWVNLLMAMAHIYALALAALAIALKPKWAQIVDRHLDIVLLASFGVYTYRDLYPLVTFNGVPADQEEGWVLWVKVGLTFFSAIIIPLAAPRPYFPVNPEDPMELPSPEQTASLFSLFTFAFLNPIVKLANSTSAVTADLLPPLADYDRAKVLKSRAFPHVDPFVSKPKRHLFFGLMHVFRKEYAVMALSLVVYVCTGFVAPLAVKNLLHYLEMGGRDSIVKPWFWILPLFFGPYISATAFQFQTYVATHVLVQVECILTQLVLEHSLRIRGKPDTNNSNEMQSNESALTSAEPTMADSASSVGTQVGSEADTLAQSQGDARSTASASSSKPNKTSTSEPTTEKGSGSADNLIGKIINLVTSDLANITDARDFLLAVVYIPLEATLCMIFLYSILGWSALAGLAVMLVCIPLPTYVASLWQAVQVVHMKKTDARVQSVSETMNILRMVKLFGWEEKMDDRIREKREEELALIWKRQVFSVTNRTINVIQFLDPPFCDGDDLCSFCLFPPLKAQRTHAHTAEQTLVMKRELTASIVFSSMTVFDKLQSQLHMVFYLASQLTAGWLSLDRVDAFLRKTELLDAFTETTGPSLDPHQTVTQSNDIGFHDASFTWSHDSRNTSPAPSRRIFTLSIEGDLFFPRSQLSLIVGPTGSGKTALLMALLGEMHFVPMASDSWFNLPRSGGVAYAAQESWVQNETIKNNILFGSPYDETRYQKVIHQCGLTHDLALFEAGDRTEVGERGLTLSGGQKARVTLARAIYSKAEILLLDDILAALDVHTSKWIVEKCLEGDLVKGRTVVMVTHNVALASTAAQFVVVLGEGKVVSQGSISEALRSNRALAEEFKTDKEMITKVNDEVDQEPMLSKPIDGKLIVAEEVEQGRVSWNALKTYFSTLGGKSPVLVISSYLAFVLLAEATLAGQTWFLGYWAWEYTIYPPSSVPNLLNIGIFSGLVLFGALAHALGFLLYGTAFIRASRVYHAKLVQSVLRATLRWLDATPISRILVRCTQDIRAVDEPLPQVLRWLIAASVTLLVKFTAVVLLTPAFLLPGVLVAVVGAYYGQIYIQTQLPVKRELSNAKQPVLAHFSAAIAGLTSLRAYGAQEAFVNQSLERIDRYSRAARTHYNLSRWIGVRIDVLGSLFAAGLAAYLVYSRDLTASNTGFSLNMAVGFSGVIFRWIRVLNEFEVQGNSLERIERYVDVEHEKKPSEDGVPPAYWPADGTLHVQNLSARYSPGGPRVLHDISFEVKSGERVGIVGRTGSGKSSLTLALLRCIFTEGTVIYAGRDTSTLNLDALRGSLTIIPQMASLHLRQNLDPFDQYDDATLNAALTSAGLFSLQAQDGQAGITLDSSISSGGGNLSVGQRQIIALARAIVRGSKLLILDEATSAIDHKTDAVIQSSLRNEIGSDVTILTVAHRLHTIMDSDKIMVLDAGRIAEFGKPSDLLKNPDSKLRALVDESGDRESLQALAGFGM